MSTAPEALAVTLSMAGGPGQVIECELVLPAGACLRDALARAGMGSAEGLDVGIWGRPAQPATPLKTGDRVEVYRPLQVDPKIARRERFRRQGARATGLFASQRPGGKAGY